MVNEKVVVFRADASLQIGSGHIMRCLTLANMLRSEGWVTYFVCGDYPGKMTEILRTAGHRVHFLVHQKQALAKKGPQSDAFNWLASNQADDASAMIDFLRTLGLNHQPDWLVVDHYALGLEWERAVRSRCKHLMVIDDLANREHQCDILLDQTYGRPPSDYAALVPQGTRILCGASYALLRPEFAVARPISLHNKQSGPARHILISMGGSDPDNITKIILDILSDMPALKECRVSVVVGPQSQHLASISSSTFPFPCKILTGVEDMAALMTSCDIAIGAAGSTSWERCCLALPSIMIIIADNQKLIAHNLARDGAALAINLDELRSDLPVQLNSLLSDSNLRKNMSGNAAAIVNGQGAQAVLNVILERKSNIW